MGDTVIISDAGAYRRTFMEIKSELGGVLAIEYQLLQHGFPFGNGELVDDDLYNFRKRGRNCTVLSGKDGKMYTRMGRYRYHYYDDEIGEEIRREWEWINNEPLKVLSPSRSFSYVDVKIIRK